MDAIAPHLGGVLLALGVFGLGLLSPGPNIMAVIGTSMGRDRASGKALAFGVATGSFLWGLSTLFGLTALIALYASVMIAIKIGGALYLLWLAFKSFRSACRRQAPPPRALSELRGLGAYYRRGLLIQMSNPKAALTWIAVMSLTMTSETPAWVGGAVVIGATALSAAGHLVYAVAFSTRPMVEAYRRARRSIEAGLGAFFCFASYKLLTTRA